MSRLPPVIRCCIDSPDETDRPAVEGLGPGGVGVGASERLPDGRRVDRPPLEHPKILGIRVAFGHDRGPLTLRWLEGTVRGAEHRITPTGNGSDSVFASHLGIRRKPRVGGLNQRSKHHRIFKARPLPVISLPPLGRLAPSWIASRSISLDRWVMLQPSSALADKASPC